MLKILVVTALLNNNALLIIVSYFLDICELCTAVDMFYLPMHFFKNLNLIQLLCIVYKEKTNICSSVNCLISCTLFLVCFLE